MKEINFDICNGLDSLMDMNNKPINISQGMGVVLRLNGVEVHIDIISMNKEDGTFLGKVIEKGKSLNANQDLLLGNIVKFKRETIDYPLSTEKSIL